MSHAVEHIDVRNNPKVKKQKQEEKPQAPPAQAVNLRAEAESWKLWFFYLLQDSLTFLVTEARNNP
jgi:hypothetical protein